MWADDDRLQQPRPPRKEQVHGDPSTSGIFRPEATDVKWEPADCVEPVGLRSEDLPSRLSAHATRWRGLQAEELGGERDGRRVGRPSTKTKPAAATRINATGRATGRDRVCPDV